MLGAMLSSVSPVVNVIVKAIEKASRGVLRDFYELTQMNSSIDKRIHFVEKAIDTADRIIVNELHDSRPDASISSFHSGNVVGSDVRSKWIIHPLDGIWNYAQGYSYWSISAALEEDGIISDVVVCYLTMNEIFHASKDKGAYCNNRRIRVSTNNSIESGMIASSRIHQNIIDHINKLKANSAFCNSISTLLNQFRYNEVRNYGSISLDVANVAAGRIDAFITADIMPHEAIGSLLIKEAKGIFTGSSDKKALIAANLDLYEQLSEIIDKN